MVAHIKSYIGMLSETNQDCLEEQGGTCIMYTHFGHGFVEDQRLNSRFADLMTRLSKRNGWFVPVSTLLDCVAAQREPYKHVIVNATGGKTDGFGRRSSAERRSA